MINLVISKLNMKICYFCSVKFGELNTDADGKCDFKSNKQNTDVQLQELNENGKGKKHMLISLLATDTRFPLSLSAVQREYILFHDFMINSALSLIVLLFFFFFKGENEILYTYDVKWEKSDIRWASRWDIYLTMSDVQIHWFSIINSVVVVIFLSGMMSYFHSPVMSCECIHVLQ